MAHKLFNGDEHLMRTRLKNGPPFMTPEIFWSRVVPDGYCLIWTGCKCKDGYGKVTSNYKTLRAHRYAYEITFGPPGKKQVHHTCDNPACVNPDHLWLGDQKDNMQDMIKKGRKAYSGVQGEKHPKAKLTEKDVRYIRRSELPIAAMASQFNVSRSTIEHARSRRNWKHVT